MNKGSALTVAAVILSLAAANISFNLLAKHMSGASGPAWFDAGCSDDPQSAANCDAVLASPYSYWPVKNDGDDANTKHYPVALLGMFYYSMLVVWFVAVGRPSYSRRLVQLLPLTVVACGLVGSAYFVYVMFTKLDSWCPWCVVTHAINLSIAVLLVLMWPRAERQPETVPTTPNGKTGGEDAENSASPPPAQTTGRAYPSFRHVVTTALAALAVVFGQYQLFDKASYAGAKAKAEYDFKQCVQIVNKLKADPNTLLAAWQRETARDVTIRPDDPARTDAAPNEPTMEVVAFSDFECPSCKRFAILFERDIQPLFDNKLTAIFKHHPLDSVCNTRLSRSVHPHACEAARMAEAARLLGGVDKFWQTHDHLFNSQTDLEKGKITPEWLAERIQVDPTALRAAMESTAVAERIAEDVALANACKVTSTPTVFVDGKLVDTITRGEIGFWDKLADTYWAKAGIPRPEHTKRAQRRATRDSRGRKAAP